MRPLPAWISMTPLWRAHPCITGAPADSCAALWTVCALPAAAAWQGKLAASVVFLPERRRHLRLPAAESVFCHEQYVSGGLPVLESGARIYSGGCAPGSGGPADYADSGRKYGLDD